MGFLEDVAATVGAVVESAATYVEEELARTTEAATTVVNNAIDAGRAAVNENFGDSLLGDVLGVALDAADIANAGLGLATDVIGATIGAIGRSIGSISRGDSEDLGEIWEDWWGTVQEEFDEAFEQAANYIIDQEHSIAERNVESCPKERGDHFAIGSSGGAKRGYTDSGKRFEYGLIGGEVLCRVVVSPDVIGDSQVTDPSISDDQTGLLSALNYHKFRQPREESAPPFDMLVAGGDRVVAKKRATDDLYFLQMDETFCETALPGGKAVPTTYFKLDPEKNFDDAKTQDLTAHLAGEYGGHPQAERNRFFSAALEFGLLESMAVRVKPRVWHRIDARPPRTAVENNSKEVPLLGTDFRKIFSEETLPFKRYPLGLPAYEHVAYVPNNALIPDYFRRIRHSILFDKVMDIGVGNMHFYETWQDDYGGEMQAQFVQHVFNTRAFSLSYALLNGPLFDADGFVDGTCNFYLLVRFPASPPGQPNPIQRFGILWIDEQSYFTTRWRLLHPRDNLPIDFDPLRSRTNFSLVSSLATHYGLELFQFNPNQYWDPFLSGCIDDNSRMAVAKQIVAVSGKQNGLHEIYTINFSWGSMDRTWRWRRFDHAGLTSMDGCTIDKSTPPNCIFPQTLKLRDDLFLLLRGTKTGRNGKTVAGVWFQRYLPADCLPVPTGDRLRSPAAGQGTPLKPGRGYTHPWQFLPDHTLEIVQLFSHFMVYSPVNSRSQYYHVEMIEYSDRFSPAEDAVWVEVMQSEVRLPLYIKARKFDWNSVPRRLRSLPDFKRLLFDTIPKLLRRESRIKEIFDLIEDYCFRWEESPPNGDFESQSRRSLTSAYNDRAQFIIKDRGPSGLIAVWADKRDDDLISISDLPREAVFCPRDGPDSSKIILRLKSNIRLTKAPVVQKVTVTHQEQAGEVSIRVMSNETASELDINLWRVHIGVVNCAGEKGTKQTLRASWLWHEHFQDSDQNALPPEVSLFRTVREATVTLDIRLASQCSDQGRFDHGTSVWFEGVTGKVASAELTEFLDGSKDG